MQRSPRAGNGCIKVLVAIAIIAISCACFLPAVGKVKERKLRAMCVSNLNAIGRVLLLYTSDYDQKMPLFKSEKEWGREIPVCPKAKDINSSYAANPMLSGVDTSRISLKRTAVFWDGKQVLPKEYQAAFETGERQDIPGLDMNRHNGTNVYFLNGRVECYIYGDSYNPYIYGTPYLLNTDNICFRLALKEGVSDEQR